MNSSFESLIIEPTYSDTLAINFCEKFVNNPTNRFVFGCNNWAQSISKKIEIVAFVDDFFKDKLFFGKPVIRSHELPKNALVVSAVVGERPITAINCINNQGVECLDYFAFQKYSRLTLKPVFYINEFESEFKSNRHQYEWIFNNLDDLESKLILSKIINFRLSRELKFMDGFVNAQDRQYFEPFLNLKPNGECFLDIGCFDGYTSLEFIKRCPDYSGVHVFEPDLKNMDVVKSKLQNHKNIHFHSYGVSDQPQVRSFDSNGSASMVSNKGTSTIEVKRVDDVISMPYSFLKMDIEGGELAALKGAGETISRYTPRLAISVYHKVDDLWKIPKQILEFCSDYRIFLRHYTEGVTETVMFFIPKSQTI